MPNLPRPLPDGSYPVVPVPPSDRATPASEIGRFKQAPPPPPIRKASVVVAPGQTLSEANRNLLNKYDGSATDPHDLTLVGERRTFRPQLVAILQKWPDISQAPPNIRAAIYGISHLGDTHYGFQGRVEDPYLATSDESTWKCNMFVAKSYGLGANVGYCPNDVPAKKGYPANGGGLANLGRYHPPSANDLHNPHVRLQNLNVVSSPQIGDIAAFTAPSTPTGHAAIHLGGNLLIYAGPHDVKLGTVPYVNAEGYTIPPTYRRYSPNK